MDTAASSTFSFQGSNGAGFAIPINTALSIAKQIVAGHSSSTIHIGATPMLGVEVAQNRSARASAARSAHTTAHWSCEAIGGTPAAAAGLTEGDTIVELGGHTIGSASALVRVKDLYHPGDQRRGRHGSTPAAGATPRSSVSVAARPTSDSRR